MSAASVGSRIKGVQMGSMVRVESPTRGLCDSVGSIGYSLPDAGVFVL
jgi:hypothetical protein